MKLTIYEYPKCGTCRTAIKSLKAKGYELESHNVFETAPSAEAIEELIKRSGLDIKKFFNTSGDVYKEMGLKDVLPGMSDEEKIKLLAFKWPTNQTADCNGWRTSYSWLQR